jgi:hypothetical protein
VADQTPFEKDYPIEIRDEDWSVSLKGDVLLTGEPAEKVRRWLVNYPQYYPRVVVPYIRKHEPSFRPNQIWIDQNGRIHITNKRVAQRMRRYLQQRHGSRSTQDKPNG